MSTEKISKFSADRDWNEEGFPRFVGSDEVGLALHLIGTHLNDWAIDNDRGLPVWLALSNVHTVHTVVKERQRDREKPVFRIRSKHDSVENAPNCSPVDLPSVF